jgi:LysR family transcriptional regulator, regulator for bpeEF and oprC
MNHCDPNDMLLFAKVAELHGISAAARALGRPKATLSRAIVRLETALNARLLERSSRQVVLTQSGRIFLAHCQRVSDEVGAAEARVGEFQGSVRGLLRVAVPITFGRAQLSPMLPKLLRKYPELRVEIRLTDRAFDPIDDGFDVVGRPGPLGASSLMSRELGRSAYGIYASPNYLATHAPIAHPQDLAAHAVVDSAEGDDSTVWSFECRGQRQDVRVVPRLDSNDAVMRRDAAIEGLGIALVPSSICADAVRSSRLREVLTEWKPMRSATVYALWPSRRHVTPRLRAFLDFLTEEIPLERSATAARPEILLLRA